MKVVKVAKVVKVTFEHRHENKSCSACRERVNERMCESRRVYFGILVGAQKLRKNTFSKKKVWKVV